MLCWLCKKNWEAFLFPPYVLKYLSGAWRFKEFNGKTSWSGAFCQEQSLPSEASIFILGSRSYPFLSRFLEETNALSFQCLPSTNKHVLSLNHLKHTSMYSLVPQNFSLPVKTCSASVYSRCYLLKLLLYSRHWEKREWAAFLPSTSESNKKHRCRQSTATAMEGMSMLSRAISLLIVMPCQTSLLSTFIQITKSNNLIRILTHRFAIT